MPLAGAAHGFGEHQHLERFRLAVGAGLAGDADIGAHFDVVERQWLHRRHGQRVVQHDIDLGPIAGRDGQVWPDSVGDGAADTGGRRGLRDRGDGEQAAGERQRNRRVSTFNLPMIIVAGGRMGTKRGSGRGAVSGCLRGRWFGSHSAGGQPPRGAAITLMRRKLTLAALRRQAVLTSLSPPVTLGRAVASTGFVQADPIRAPARAQDLILRHRVAEYRGGRPGAAVPPSGAGGGFPVRLWLHAARDDGAAASAAR